MKQIQLTKGKVALVDNGDYARLSRYKWYARCTHKRYWYAACSSTKQDGTQTILLMHRLVLNTPIGMRSDHISGDGLDNRRSNLRVCSHAENIRFQRLNRKNTSGFKGVTIRKDVPQKPFRAHITVKRKQIHLGYYPTAETAAQIYDDAALKYFGDFALLNNRAREIR